MAVDRGARGPLERESFEDKEGRAREDEEVMLDLTPGAASAGEEKLMPDRASVVASAGEEMGPEESVACAGTGKRGGNAENNYAEQIYRDQ